MQGWSFTCTARLGLLARLSGQTRIGTSDQEHQTRFTCLRSTTVAIDYQAVIRQSEGYFWMLLPSYRGRQMSLESHQIRLFSTDSHSALRLLSQSPSILRFRTSQWP